MLISIRMILLNATHEWSGKIHLASSARDWDDLWKIMKARLFAVLFTHQGKCNTDLKQVTVTVLGSIA